VGVGTKNSSTIKRFHVEQRYKIQLRTDLAFDVIDTSTGTTAHFYSEQTATIVASMLNCEQTRFEWRIANAERKAKKEEVLKNIGANVDRLFELADEHGDMSIARDLWRREVET
jgi:nitrous oxide reductase